MNHSCNPNVLYWRVDEANAIIHYSARPIKTGEEICITYRTIWGCRSEDKEAQQHSLLNGSLNLKIKWGIFCPLDCICNDLSILPLVAECTRLSNVAIRSGTKGDFETSLAASKARLQLCNTHPRLMGNCEIKFAVLNDAFGAATLLKDKKRAKEATAFLKEMNEIVDHLEFPTSEKSLAYQNIANDPRLHEKIKEVFCELNDMYLM